MVASRLQEKLDKTKLSDLLNVPQLPIGDSTQNFTQETADIH